MRSRSPMFIDDRRGGSRRSVGRWLAILLGVVVLLSVVVGLLLWWYAGSKLTPVEVDALDEPPATTDGEGGTAASGGAGDPTTTNTLVVVTDSPDEGDAVTESVLLVQTGRGQPVVLSFPPGLRVPHAGEGLVRLAEVLPNAGIGAVVTTVQDFTGIDLDHHVTVDASAASRLTAALGGVEVCLDQPFADPAVDLDLPSGCTVIDAVQADAFARSDADSEEFGSAEFGRAARRLRLVHSAAAEISSLGTLARPPTVKSVIDAVAATLDTDRELGLLGLRSLASTIAGTDAADVLLRTVPGTVQTIGGETFVVAAAEQAPDMFETLARGEPLDPALGTEVAGELGPANVNVLVVNGVGIAGLAGDVRSYLEERDFRVIDAVNPSDLDPDAEFDTSLRRLTIRHSEATQPHAEVLQGHLGRVPVDLAQVPADQLPPDAQVVLVVGSAWNDRS